MFWIHLLQHRGAREPGQCDLWFLNACRENHAGPDWPHNDGLELSVAMLVQEGVLLYLQNRNKTTKCKIMNKQSLFGQASSTKLYLYPIIEPLSPDRNKLPLFMIRSWCPSQMRTQLLLWGNVSPFLQVYFTHACSHFRAMSKRWGRAKNWRQRASCQPGRRARLPCQMQPSLFPKTAASKRPSCTSQ